MGLEIRKILIPGKMQVRLTYGTAMGLEIRKILNPGKMQVRLLYGHAMGLKARQTREIINPCKKQSDWITDMQ